MQFDCTACQNTICTSAMYSAVPATTLNMEFLFHRYVRQTTAIEIISGTACGSSRIEDGGTDFGIVIIETETDHMQFNEKGFEY